MMKSKTIYIGEPKWTPTESNIESFHKILIKEPTTEIQKLSKRKLIGSIDESN